MPIYEYVCASCDHEFEEFVHSTRDKGPSRCPKCDAKTVQRRLSVFAARLGAEKSGGPPIGPCGRPCDPNGPCSL